LERALQRSPPERERPPRERGPRERDPQDRERTPRERPPRRERPPGERGQTSSLRLRLKDLVGLVTRVKKKKKNLFMLVEQLDEPRFLEPRHLPMPHV